MTSESRDLWKDHNSLSQPGCLNPRSATPEARQLAASREQHFDGDDVDERDDPRTARTTSRLVTPFAERGDQHKRRP
jgi:hypothetical protein